MVSEFKELVWSRLNPELHLGIRNSLKIAESRTVQLPCINIHDYGEICAWRWFHLPTDRISIVLYVRSFSAAMGTITESPAGSFSCVAESSHGARSQWDSSKSEIAGSAGKFLSEADRQAMIIATRVVEQAEIDMKVIDVGRSFWTRIKYLFKGIFRTPRFFIDGKSAPSISSADQLFAQIQ